MRALYVVGALGLLACSPSVPPVPSAAPGATPAPPASKASPPQTGEVVFAYEVDLDGDGSDDPVRVLVERETCDGFGCAGELVVGEARDPLPIRDGNEAGLDVQVIDVDPTDGRGELLLRQAAPGDVDPPSAFTLVRLVDGELRMRELWTGVNAGEAEVPGDGTLITRYDACPEVVTVVYELAAGGLAEIDRSREETRAATECTACPMVYIQGQPWGEILRHLDEPAKATWQSLRLRPSTAVVDGWVAVRLQEEKEEVTYLDAIVLEADGKRLLPTGCGAGTHCGVDGAHSVLHRGDSMTLRFRVPERPRTLTLWARGHYVPLR